MIKKILVTLTILLTGVASNATPVDDVAAFFDKYVNAANSYSETIPEFYLPNAKIIRVVIKKDGTRESVSTDTSVYMKQLKMNAKIAKMRGYKNFYTDRKIIKIGDDYKLFCNRQPSLSKYKLPAHFIIGKDSSGNYKIKEESMDTYQTAILVGAKKQSK